MLSPVEFENSMHDILYIAAYSAFWKTCEDDINNIEHSSLKNQISDNIKKVSEKFGTEFADKASPDLSKLISDYIQMYIDENSN